MKNIIFTLLILFTSLSSFGQINMEDSSAQVISYWEKGEKQSYTVSTEKYKIKDDDTTSLDITTYDVEITVMDSSEKSYTIEWFYKNIKSNSQSKIYQKMINITKDMKVVFKTDELGVFVEVVNWEEIRDIMLKASLSLKNEFKNIPEMDQMLTQIETKYTTKEAIESSTIKDIQQFHMFHGLKYVLGEVLEGNLKIPNIIGSEPFDAILSISLDEIDEEDDNFIIRSTQEIDKEQLINATFDYITMMAKQMKIDPPKKEELSDLSNEIITASRMHGTGWVIYSVQTTSITSDNTTNIEERIIEIK